MRKSILVFFSLMLAVPLIPFVVWGEIDGMKWMEGTTGWITFIYGILLLALDILLPLPSSLIAVFLGAHLGILLGGLSVFIGLMTGSLIGFGMGWVIGRSILDRMISKQGQQLYDRLEHRMSYWALVLCRAVPILAEASVIAAGVARLEVRKTLPMLVMSNLGLALLYSAFGYYGEQQASPLLLLAGGIVVPACGMLILLVLFGKSLFSRPTPDRIC